jgi:NAD(P)-dependent dehydrogenase (short-subunit alcohol dehydrogenase family)
MLLQNIYLSRGRIHWAPALQAEANLNINFSDRSVVVAGGAGGLGRAVTLAFLDEGAKVFVPYAKEDEFLALQNSAAQNLSSLQGRQVDVTDESDTANFINGVLTKHGAVDVLVNTVGGYAGGVKLWNMNTAIFDRMLALNLRSGYALARSVLPSMLKAGRGAIVNIAAKAAIDHAAGAAAYAASKAAALALMDSLAADCVGTGVRVNSVLPSIIDTPANRLAMPNSDFQSWPKPGDIAQVILFLSSDAAKTVHGAAVPVYGNG